MLSPILYIYLLGAELFSLHITIGPCHAPIRCTDITDGSIVLMMNKLYKWVVTFSHFSRVQHKIVPRATDGQITFGVTS